MGIVALQPLDIYIMKTFDDFYIDLDDHEKIESRCKEIVLKVREDWNCSRADELSSKVFKDGTTNVLYGIFRNACRKDMVLVRIYGHKTEEIIDRDTEMDNMRLFQEHGCGSILYGTFANGLTYSFIHGQIPTQEMIVDKAMNQSVIEMMAKMHKMRLGGQPCLWTRLKKFLKAIPDGFMNGQHIQEKFAALEITCKEDLKREIDELELSLTNTKSPVVFCHNDLLLGNIVYDANRHENKAIFIDFEYSGQNYQALDIGNHFSEFVGVVEHMDYDKWYPNREFQLDWIRRYLAAFHDGIEPSLTDIEETYKDVNKFALCGQLTWIIWSIVQASNSTLDFDFIEYARQRLQEYRKRKHEFLAL